MPFLLVGLKLSGLNVFIQVLHAFATEGAHCTKVRDILDASDVSLYTPFHFPTLHVCGVICLQVGIF
jgi:hypothetical protein